MLGKIQSRKIENIFTVNEYRSVWIWRVYNGELYVVYDSVPQTRPQFYAPSLSPPYTWRKFPRAQKSNGRITSDEWIICMENWKVNVATRICSVMMIKKVEVLLFLI